MFFILLSSRTKKKLKIFWALTEHSAWWSQPSWDRALSLTSNYSQLEHSELRRYERFKISRFFDLGLFHARARLSGKSVKRLIKIIPDYQYFLGFPFLVQKVSIRRWKVVPYGPPGTGGFPTFWGVSTFYQADKRLIVGGFVLFEVETPRGFPFFISNPLGVFPL